jgi:uncharacterized short protein YbdD (DUF466 family)
MKTIFDGNVAAAPAQAASADSGSHARGTRLSDLARTARQAYLQLFGIPDYERYLAHMASHHPCDQVLSRREFFIQSVDRKYGRSGPRCC